MKLILNPGEGVKEIWSFYHVKFLKITENKSWVICTLIPLHTVSTFKISYIGTEFFIRASAATLIKKEKTKQLKMSTGKGVGESEVLYIATYADI